MKASDCYVAVDHMAQLAGAEYTVTISPVLGNVLTFAKPPRKGALIEAEYIARGPWRNMLRADGNGNRTRWPLP